ncbi:hypothetical protein QBC46DRAFT_359048 [Diplogelasinospora grovesii]|uniref:Uncharacterized protein n=1 Tax=Diplogelasinospora grovesii TaxID=303347 RepID=A0AAN6MW45_9PEZI|nr:hypothetical protein QBC46DRAFT_359048 [Diplogelasinospora grovesii]
MSGANNSNSTGGGAGKGAGRNSVTPAVANVTASGSEASPSGSFEFDNVVTHKPAVQQEADYEFRARNHPITVRDVKDSDPFPPWVKLPPSQQARHESKTVRDKFNSDEIELMLRCASLIYMLPSPSQNAQSGLFSIEGRSRINAYYEEV